MPSISVHIKHGQLERATLQLLLEVEVDELETLFLMQLKVPLFACVSSGDKLRLSNVSLLVNRTKPNGPKGEVVLHCLSLMSYKAASSPRFSLVPVQNNRKIKED